MNRLRQVRLSKGMNQKELAEALNLSQAAISGYETGKYDPGMKIWKLIAEYFGVSVDYLIEDVPTDKKSPANQKIDEVELDAKLIDLLLRLDEQDMARVQAFVQGLLAAREDSSSHHS